MTRTAGTRAWKARGGPRAYLIGIALLLLLTSPDRLLLFASFATLWLIWRLLGNSSVNIEAVLPMALTFQWGQCSAALVYEAGTGRRIWELEACDYHVPVLLSLGSITALALGLWLGKRRPGTSVQVTSRPLISALETRLLFHTYIVMTLSEGVVGVVAWSIPAFTQAILALGYMRFGALYLLLRRAVSPRFDNRRFFGLLLFELVLGFSGYFATFREPLMLGAISLVEVSLLQGFRRFRRPLLTLVVLVPITAVVWTSVKGEYRAGIRDDPTLNSRWSRIEFLGQIVGGRFGEGLERYMSDMDSLVSRTWVVYYPALAIARVPRLLPHTDGEILRRAVSHVLMPRFLFPEKQPLVSDSMQVRRYSGVHVAGEESGTSIAFGYVAESYLDLGVPWMFIPSLLYGIAMGWAFRWFQRRVEDPDLLVGFVTVVFWLSLYLFERSWARTLGLSGTLLIYVGGLTMILDRWLKNRRRSLPGSLRSVSRPLRRALNRTEVGP